MGEIIDLLDLGKELEDIIVAEVIEEAKTAQPIYGDFKYSTSFWNDFIVELYGVPSSSATSEVRHMCEMRVINLSKTRKQLVFLADKYYSPDDTDLDHDFVLKQFESSVWMKVTSIAEEEAEEQPDDWPGCDYDHSEH